jgi:hypothetical protein
MDTGTHAYVFIGRGWWGFTNDADGRNLPDDGSPWSFFRNAKIDAAAAGSLTDEEKRILTDLNAKGFSVSTNVDHSS